MSEDTKDLHTGTDLAREYDITSGRISQIINKLDASDELIKSGNKKFIPKDLEDKIRKQLDSSVEERSKSTDDTLLAVNKELRERIKELTDEKRALRADLDKTNNNLTVVAQSNIALSEKLKAIEAPRDVTNDEVSIADELKRVIEEQNRNNDVANEEINDRLDKLQDEIANERSKNDVTEKDYESRVSKLQDELAKERSKGFFKRLFGN